MKLTTLFLVAVYLHVSAAGYGQKVSVTGKDMPLEKVFNMIHKQAGYVCFYTYDLLQGKKVTLDLKNADVEDVMKACLWEQGLDFSITGKTITIVKREEKGAMLPKGAVAGPGKTVKASGTVYNESGQPLSGANVTIKATGKGTITNAKGEFELPSVPENSPLVISFIGYAPQTVKVNEGKAVLVYLNVAKNELDKVVVQAYGTTTQRLATGNIATVTAKEIEKQPIANPLQALQGRVAGLTITQTNGYTSAPFKVEIRGRSSLQNFPSDPLYIIDGVPLTVLEIGNLSSYNNGSTGFIQNGTFLGPARGQSPFFSINPGDIESITVLKDADATAIYGSRGANGAIIINTKKGSAGKSKVEINAYQGMEEVTRYYNTLNTKQYVQMRNEAFKNDGIVPDPGSAYDLLVWDTTQYTDWQKYLWGNIGKTTDLQMSVSGGNTQTQFRAGGSYRHETDITTAKGASQRGSVLFTVTHKSLDQRFNISFDNLYSVTNVNMIDIGGIATIAPNSPLPFDSKGNLNYAGWAPANSSFPFAPLLQPYNATTYFLNDKLSLKYEIIKGVSVSTNLGYSNATVSQHSINPISAQDPSNNPTGIANFGNNNLVNWIVEPQVEYSSFINKGKLSVLVGASTQSVSANGNVITGSGYTNDNLLGSVANSPQQTASDVYGRYKYAAIFGRINYNWGNKYVINLSTRRDGSSRFGPGKQFGNFGAVGATWIFSEEEWFKRMLPILSFGKIRGSYGLTGSDQIGDYKYLTRWSSANIPPYQGGNSYVPLQHANPNYQWQVNKKLEVALSLGFLKDRLNFEASYYRNRCGNQLIPYPLASITGFTSVIANSLANVQNSGIEFLLNSKIIDSKDIEWNVALNVTRNRNKLLAYPNLLSSPYAYKYFIGQPLNIAGKLHFLGIDPMTGQYAYEDKNKDGVINPNTGVTSDLYYIDLNPKFFGGLGSDLRYKNWQLSVFFNFIRQAGYNVYGNTDVPGIVGANEPVEVLNRWQKPGDNAQYARFTTQPTIADGNFHTSDGILTDASYIRLQNLSISYNFKNLLFKTPQSKSCRVYLQGQNLFVITKYKGIDPETQAFGSMPIAKIFTGGVQISF